MTGGDADDLGGADLVPGGEVGQVVLDRPAVERRFGQECVTEVGDGGEQVFPHGAVVAQQFFPVFGHLDSSRVRLYSRIWIGRPALTPCRVV